MWFSPALSKHLNVALKRSQHLKSKMFFPCSIQFSPAEKFIISRFSSYSFTSRSKHHNRHEHTVQVVRTSLPKISQVPQRHTSFLWLPSILQGRVHICLAHDKAHCSLVGGKVLVAFLLQLLCVLLEALTRVTTKPCGSGTTVHDEERKGHL